MTAIGGMPRTQLDGISAAMAADVRSGTHARGDAVRAAGGRSASVGAKRSSAAEIVDELERRKSPRLLQRAQSRLVPANGAADGASNVEAPQQRPPAAQRR